MSTPRSFVPIAGVLLAGVVFAQDQQPKPWQPPADLAKASARSAVHNKRVLAVLPAAGEDLAATLKKDKVLSRKLLYEFEAAQLTGADAAAAAGHWQAGDARPALVVLAAGGDVLAKFAGADFMQDGAVASQALLTKLEPHFCAPVDAEQKLAAGIAQAKKTGRNVFVRFDAPW